MPSEEKVLIIGGAGFIGSHTADELAKRGFEVRILDNLSPRTHNGDWPAYLNPKFEKIKGDARNKEDMSAALDRVSHVIHLAAYMDLMPDFSTFFDTNVTSTALLYQLIVENKFPIKKVVVASSQFVYGEGRYSCADDGIVFPKLRTTEDLMKKQWEPVCPLCGKQISPLVNLESHQNPPNQYAISKYTQEMIALTIGKLYEIPSSVMRYSIVHGPRQSLKNAYSGALRIFALNMLADQNVPIYEDGMQQRDFVSVYDVARANAEALLYEKSNWENFNVGGGKSYTVMELARMIKKSLNKSVELIPTGEFRVGDIRHAVSDISKLMALGWKPEISEEKTVEDYLRWLQTESNYKTYLPYLSRAEKHMSDIGVLRNTE